MARFAAPETAPAVDDAGSGVRYIVALAPGGVWWAILEVTGMVGRSVAMAEDEPTATRIACLLNRHGVVDVPLDQVTGR